MKIASFALNSSIVLSVCAAMPVQAADDDRSPASTVIEVPDSTAPRSALRESDSQAPVAAPTGEENQLTGNWGGSRTALSQKGIDIALVGKYETGRNLSGGNKIGNFNTWNLDLRAAFDTEKMGVWKGGSFFFYYLANQGDHPTEYVGDLQATSNLEASSSVSRLYEAWFQQKMFDDKVSIILGLHDLNSEFYVTDSSTLFFNASFGIGQEIAQTGSNGPSIFPVTAPAIRLRVEPTKHFYFQAAAFSAVAGDPDHPQGTFARWTSEEGSLLIAEAAYVRGAEEASGELSSKYAIGTWTYTRQVDQISSGEKTDNRGAYLLVDQGITEQIAAFLRIGFTTGEPASNTVSSNSSAGILFRGLLPFRPKDVLGLAVTNVGASSAYRDAQSAVGASVASSETTTELTYRAELGQGLAIQPDLQYIDHPSLSNDVSHALAAAVRLQIDF